jgi:hypothetical protein
MSEPHHHLPFLDWLKAVGISLIVWGHVAAATTTTWTPPVYPKQLGVAFFVFAMGYTLPQTRRKVWAAVYHRYVEVFLFGSVCALLMSGVGLFQRGDLAESNYLPLVLGLNVFMNAFPANPTTWFIGTYLHLLLFWALFLRKVRITLALLAGSCLLEILGRTLLVQWAGSFVAYMLILNWFTVFLLGIAMGQGLSDRHHVAKATPAFLLALVIGWPVALAYVQWDLTFPFMSPAGFVSFGAAVGTSAAVSFVYVTYSYTAFMLASLCPRVALVEFVARNTLIVFIAHMPVYYTLESLLRPVVRDYATRVTIEFFICLPVLALLSEGVRAVIRPTELREALARWLLEQRTSPTAPVA